MTRRAAGVVATLSMLAVVVVVTAGPSSAQASLCDGRAPTITGTTGDDRIEGTPGNDVIVALEGRDVVFGRGGNDIICGGPGRDVIKGGTGNDTMIGGGGNDRLLGGIGRDRIDGGNGKDRIFAGGGKDWAKGGRSSDLVRGDNGIDTCELDASDRFAACERGDVFALSGVGSGSFDFMVPPESAFASWSTGPQAVSRAYTGEVRAPIGSPSFGVALSNASNLAGTDLGIGIEVSEARRFVVTAADAQPIGSVTIDGLRSTDAWTLTLFGSDVVSAVPSNGVVTGVGSGTFSLGAVQPGQMVDVGVDGNDEPTDVVVALLGPSSGPRLLLDDRFESQQDFLAFNGSVPTGGFTHVVVEASGAVSLIDLVGFTVTFTAP